MGSAGELKDGKLEVKFAKLGFYPVCFKSKNAKGRGVPSCETRLRLDRHHFLGGAGGLGAASFLLSQAW